jgi:hypothetical protein
MSAEKPENNFLADLAGIEFECSIAAAELNKRVYRLLGGESYSKVHSDPYNDDVQIVGHRGSELVNACLLNSQYYYAYGGEKLPVKLVQPVMRAKKPTNIEVVPAHKRRWLSRNVVTTTVPATVSKRTKYDTPMLGVCFDDVIVPLAMFNQRLEDESCSYVQLGSEIHGDAFFATRLDEQTSRNDIIESLREIENGWFRIGLPKQVSALAESEIRAHLPEIQRLLMAQLHHYAEKRINIDRFSEKGQLVERQNSGTIVHESTYQPLGPLCELPNGVHGWLALSKDMQSGALTIGTVTRGRILFPLISFDQSGTPTFHKEQNIPIHALRQLSNIITGRPIYNYDSQLKSVISKFGVGMYADSIGLPSLVERRDYTSNRVRIYGDDIPETTSMYYIASLDGCTAELKDVDRGSNIRQYFADVAPVYERLLADLGVEKYAEDFPPDDLVNETFMTLLGHFSKQEKINLRGELANLQIGKSIGDLTFHAEILRDGSTVRLIISSRPSAMPQERFRPHYDETFDLFGKSKLAEDKAVDLVRVLNSLELTNFTAN